jgi:ribosome biogenesis GTPase A
MAIQWYPGHMTKARRVLEETMPAQDVIIEVLDARMPRASENPVVTELRRDKPCIKVLSKSDLADPEITDAWVAHFEKSPNVRALAITTERQQDVRSKLPALCKELVLHPRGLGKTVRAMIVGIPNVGKSTLINTLMERKVAKVGDEPAVTKAQQRVTLKNGMTLADNPGIMWPKIEDEQGGLCLALGGAIPDNAIDYESVALFGARFFLAHYPARLKARYKLETLPEVPAELLVEIGKRRGCLKSGGIIDMHKAGDVLVHDFRDGALGRISLEAPRGFTAA